MEEVGKRRLTDKHEVRDRAARDRDRSWHSALLPKSRFARFPSQTPSITNIDQLAPGLRPSKSSMEYLETRGFSEHITVVESLLTRFPNARGDDV